MKRHPNPMGGNRSPRERRREENERCYGNRGPVAKPANPRDPTTVDPDLEAEVAAALRAKLKAKRKI